MVNKNASGTKSLLGKIVIHVYADENDMSIRF